MIRGTRTRIGIALVTALATAGIAAGCGGRRRRRRRSRADQRGGTLFIGIDTPYPPVRRGPAAQRLRLRRRRAERDRREHRTSRSSTRTPASRRSSATWRPGQFDTAAAASTITARAREGSRLHRPLLPERDCARRGGGLGHRLRGRPRAARSWGPRTEPSRRNTPTRRPTPREVRAFPEGTDALSALLTGAVDAVLVDEAVAADSLEKQGGMEIVVESIPGDDLFGFAVAPDNDALREAMNERWRRSRRTARWLSCTRRLRQRAARQGPREHERAAHGRLATNG